MKSDHRLVRVIALPLLACLATAAGPQPAPAGCTGCDAPPGPLTQRPGSLPAIALLRQLQQLSAIHFGAVCDGKSHPLSSAYATLSAAQAVYPSAVALTDELDGTAIQAGINYLSGIPANNVGQQHGRLGVPSGTCLANEPLTTTTEGVKLRGQGVGYITGNNASAPTNTKIRWTGARGATIYAIEPAARAGLPISGDDVEGIDFDCNAGLAGTGLSIKSVSKSVIDIGYQQCSAFGFHQDTQSSMRKFSDSQINRIDIQGYDDLAGAVGVRLDGTSRGGGPAGGGQYGNTSENHYGVLNLTTRNGDALQIGNTDHNQFDYVGVTVLPGGTTRPNAVVFENAAFGASNGPARYNKISYLVTGGTVLAKGGDGRTAGGSFYNWIDVALAQGGSVIVEPGAILCISGSDKYAIVGGCMGAGSDRGITALGVTVNYHDRSATGGNPAGAGAFDGSSTRTVATHVASGAGAVAFGSDVTASGANSMATGGGTVASGPGATASGSGTISSSNDTVADGNNTTASGRFASAHGQNSAASGFAATAHGVAASANLLAEDCLASGVPQDGAGGFELCQQVLWSVAKSAAPVRLFANGATSPTAVNCVNIPPSSSASVRIQMSGYDKSSGSTASFSYSEPGGLLRTGNTASGIKWTGSGRAETLSDAAMAGSFTAVSADTKYGCLNISWTPPRGNTDRWDVSAAVTFQISK